MSATRVQPSASLKLVIRTCSKKIVHIFRVYFIFFSHLIEFKILPLVSSTAATLSAWEINTPWNPSFLWWLMYCFSSYQQIYTQIIHGTDVKKRNERTPERIHLHYYYLKFSALFAVQLRRYLGRCTIPKPLLLFILYFSTYVVVPVFFSVLHVFRLSVDSRIYLNSIPL